MMPPKLVTLTIDSQVITVPEGMLVVDAARKAGVDIPVFCYHPKMEPVGMCRMCLVEVGRPVMDRATGQPVLEPDGTPRLGFGPKLETACTTPVSEGMVIITSSPKVKSAQRDVLEFLLTSHPLDCPVCDKGGECPLQNLTMRFGPGESRFEYSDKKHLAKHVPLGELIYLDRERCIQCARCTRFAHEVVDDPVIGFYQRGRSLEIQTHSTPGFDSIFSGNTTDICPVGALTTVDFHFGARPWEMKYAASICNHCPVGCNLTINVRREARSGGKNVIKRIMPRQNEQVNETWICDKGRMVYQYTESPHRLVMPLVRKNGELVETDWEDALKLAAEKLHNPLVLAGGRLSNEDLFNLARLASEQQGRAILYSAMAGGDLVRQVGVGTGTNLKDMGRGDAILVVASDLHQEAPLWWLRVKQAAQRGATLIVLGGRETRLETYATYVIRHPYGSAAETLAKFLPGSDLSSQDCSISCEMVSAFANAANAMIFFGSDGLDYAGSEAVARVAADLLVKTGHAGRTNNGLVPVWQHGNTQGAWELGFQPSADLAADLKNAASVLIAAADPAGDDPRLAEALDSAGFVVVQELFLTETARRADVVFPAEAFTEREGTYTSGKRRVQRFYPATPPIPGVRPDFTITAQLGRKMGVDLEGRAAALVLQRIAETIPAFAGITYARLAEVVPQDPMVGRSKLYYGGTGYDNQQGLGVQLAPAAETGAEVVIPAPGVQAARSDETLRVVGINRLYDHGALMMHSTLLHQRLAPNAVWMHPDLAARFGLQEGQVITVDVDGRLLERVVHLDDGMPQAVALAVR